MGLDDFGGSVTEQKDDENAGKGGNDIDAMGMLRAVDYNIVQNAEVLTSEPTTIPEERGVWVYGDKVIADRCRLSAVIAVAISTLTHEDVKDIEELTAAELQKQSND